jgi:hypothetical protein
MGSIRLKAGWALPSGISGQQKGRVQGYQVARPFALEFVGPAWTA